MKKLIYFALGLAVMFVSCSDDDDDGDQKWVTPPSTGATMTLNGGAGEANAENSVYVDFSANEQESVKRNSWHLAFNCGKDFGVFLNSTTIGRATEAVDVKIEDVISETDLAPYATKLEMAMGGESSMEIVDNFDKAVNGTVIKEGKVYVYRTEDADLSFYKVKVTKKDDNTYTLSYALWNSSDVKSAEVKKDSKYNTIGFSFTDAKTVIIEKENWDIVWGRNTYESPMVPDKPSAMADIVFINNKAGVRAAEIMIEDIAYADYTEANLTSTTLSANVGTIGGNWRGTEGMPPVMSVKSDRYYIVQDIAGNVYKLKFLAIGGSDGATRGKPQIQFDLVKEAQ